MNEASLLASLVNICKDRMPGCVVFKHFDVTTDGIPDLSITWGKRTVWVEAKYDKGKVRATQAITMWRLGQAGLAFYVSFDFEKGRPVTIIRPGNHSEDYVVKFEKHDMRRVADFFISKVLEARRRPHTEVTHELTDKV